MKISGEQLAEKFDPQAIEAMGIAQEIAGEFKQPRVGTGEVLTALADNTNIGRILTPFGINAEAIRRQLVEVSGYGTSEDDHFIRTFTSDAEAVLEEAVKTAVSLAHDHVSPAHLLLAITAIHSDGHRILVRCGADPEEVARLAKESLKTTPKERMNLTITDTSAGRQNLTEQATRTARVLIPRDHQPGHEVVLQATVVNAPLEKNCSAVASVLNDQFTWTELLSLPVSEWRAQYQVPLPDPHTPFVADPLTGLADDLLARASRILGA